MNFSLIKEEICRELLIKDNMALVDTMITTKRTALIAAMSLLGTIAPAAFAQENNFSIDDINQAQSNYAEQYVSSGDYGYAEGTIVQNNEQGFCINVAQAA